MRNRRANILSDNDREAGEDPKVKSRYQAKERREINAYKAKTPSFKWLSGLRGEFQELEV
jgi:hypothetical protein